MKFRSAVNEGRKPTKIQFKILEACLGNLEVLTVT